MKPQTLATLDQAPRAALDPILEGFVVGALDRLDQAYRTGHASAIQCAKEALIELRESIQAMREGAR